MRHRIIRKLYISTPYTAKCEYFNLDISVRINDEMTPLYFSHPFLAFQNGAHRKFSMYFPDVR